MSNQHTESDDPLPIRNTGGPEGTGPSTAHPGGFKHGMRALRHRDFRVFLIGAVASNTGSWLQNLAVPFVLFEITNKSIYVGLAGFAQFIPSFALGPLGGSLADRLDRKKVLIAAQILMAVAAFLLWAAWALDVRDPWVILAITALTGVFNGIMIPSWQAFVPSLVPKSDLSSAITLNSTQFNASRAIGPALAGLLLATVGPAWAFFLNGVSFLAVIGALLMVHPSQTNFASGAKASVVAEFRSALSYIRQRTGILVSIVCAMLVAFFGNPVTQFTVVFAKQVYGAGPNVLGVLAAAVGIGAVMAAPALSTWDTRVSRSDVVRYGLPLYGIAVISFGLAPNWPLGLISLLFVGAGFLAVIATTNTAVQMIVTDSMRGRVMSARVMGFTLSFPLGSLVQGILADTIGPQATVVMSGGVLLIFALFLASRPRLLETLNANSDD
ncbi:MAG: MFS transporter [Acidimicrobiales bacterium]